MGERKHVGSRLSVSLAPVLVLVLAMAPPPRVAAAGVDSAPRVYPYMPTQVLMPTACFDSDGEGGGRCDGRDVAYVLMQGSDGVVEFLALNVTGEIGSESLQHVTMGLPFLADGGDRTAVGAVRASDGRVVVYSGACDGGVGELWVYSAAEDTWDRLEVEDKVSNSDPAAARRAPYFLGGTLAFSSTLAPDMSEPTIYTYGGMCATQRTDNTKDWQSAANYTKSMMSIAPKTKDQGAEELSYGLSLASSGGPRTAIAGFTLTPLPPSTTNRSGTVTQQASYVLLGGHSQRAFINMSTAAVWNLPAESWTYVDVQPPSTSLKDGSTELLAAKNVDGAKKRGNFDNVYSRSGHTAVLSEDGTSVVVLGGWVGDVGTPAEPQLAVLEMSQAYSSWQWRIPEEQLDGEDFGAGIYGHGAAVLPGNVMAVYGGWTIGSSSSSSSKMRRQTSGSGGPRFLNLTSMTWSSSYRNPGMNGPPSKDPSDAPDSNDSSDNARRLGLGLGLGLGIGLALLTAAIVAFCCWRRRRNKRRESRDMVVRALSQDMGHFTHDTDEMMERDMEFMAWNRGGWYTGGQDPTTQQYQNHQQGERSLGYESLRGSRGSAYKGGVQRKPMPRPLRGGYMPTASGPGGFGPPGGIHPILEDDEEEHHQHHHNMEPSTPTSEVPSDPFMTPTLGVAPVLPPAAAAVAGGRGSATPSPEGSRRDPDVQDWVSDVDATDALLARMNSSKSRHQTSPTRRNSHRSVATTTTRDDDSRTGSGLSESNRSAAADSLRRSPTSTGSKKPTLSLAAAASVATSSLLGGSTLLGGGSEGQKPGSSSSSSYTTARSSFGVLQAEGPSLLMGRHHHAPLSPTYDEGNDDNNVPGSPSKSKPRRNNWLGSLRRVFSSSGSNSASSSARDDSPRRASHEYDPYYHYGGGDYEPGLVGLNGELLRRKQGRHDWEAGLRDGDSSGGGGSKEGNALGGLAGEIGGENDWDIERAVEKRLVQVMFTVPRERLRVVNADEEKEQQDEEDEKPMPMPMPPQVAELVNVAAEAGPGPVMVEAKVAEDDEKQQLQEQRDDLLTVAPLRLTKVDSSGSGASAGFGDDPRRLSRSTQDSMARSDTGMVMTAKAVTVTMERPRTRVLQMVETLETKSREGSPTRS